MMIYHSVSLGCSSGQGPSRKRFHLKQCQTAGGNNQLFIEVLWLPQHARAGSRAPAQKLEGPQGCVISPFYPYYKHDFLNSLDFFLQSFGLHYPFSTASIPAMWLLVHHMAASHTSLQCMSFLLSCILF